MRRKMAGFLVAVFLVSFTGCSQKPGNESEAARQSVSVAEEATALPESTAPPQPQACIFEVDRYKVSPDAAEYLGDAESEYRTLIDAVCAGEETAAFENADRAERAVEVFGESPYAALAGVTLTEDSFWIAYSGKGDAAQFDDAAKRLVENAVYMQSNEVETAMGLYRELVSTYTMEDGEDNTLFSAVTEQRGDAKSLAAALSFLFNQNGIPSRTASGTVNGEDHAWVIAQLDDVWLHFDPAGELLKTEGKGLQCFGMSDEAFAESGGERSYRTGRGAYEQETEGLCPAGKFNNAFANVSSFEIDVYGHFAYLAYDNAEEFQGSISTENFSAPVG